MTGNPVAWAVPCTFGTGTRLVPGTPLADAANPWHITAWCCAACLTSAVGTETVGLLPRACRISRHLRPSVHHQKSYASKTRTCPGRVTARSKPSTEAPRRPSRGAGGFLLPRLGSYWGTRLAGVHPKAGPVLPWSWPWCGAGGRHGQVQEQRHCPVTQPTRTLLGSKLLAERCSVLLVPVFGGSWGRLCNTTCDVAYLQRTS